MEHSEMIEKLHSQAGVSVEVAEDALSRAGWDMLDALRLLESEGKIPPLTSSMTSSGMNDDGYEKIPPNTSKPPKNYKNTILKKLYEFFTYCFTHSFYVTRHDETVMNIPVIIMLILLIYAGEISLIALLVGLFLECKYSVEPNRNNGGESNE